MSWIAELSWTVLQEVGSSYPSTVSFRHTALTGRARYLRLERQRRSKQRSALFD
jgi:hypothetical protein